MEQKTKRCPYCGEEILAVATKCKHCGEWLNKEEQKEKGKEMIPCPICGEMIEKGISKCPYCNENINPQQLRQSRDKIEQEDDSDETKAGNSLQKIIISLFLVFVIIGLIIFVSLRSCSASNNSSKHLSSVNNTEEIKDAYLKLLDEKKTEAEKASTDMGSDLDGFTYGYFLYDITGDGIPELWLQTGASLQEVGIDVYTYNNGIDRIYHGESYICSYYDNSDYVLQVEVSQGYAVWTTLRYDGKILQAEVNDIGDLSEPKNNKYKEPTGKTIELIPLKNNSAIVTAFNDNGVKEDINETDDISGLIDLLEEDNTNFEHPMWKKILTKIVGQDNYDFMCEQYMCTAIEKEEGMMGRYVTYSFSGFTKENQDDGYVFSLSCGDGHYNLEVEITRNGKTKKYQEDN